MPHVRNMFELKCRWMIKLLCTVIRIIITISKQLEFQVLTYPVNLPVSQASTVQVIWLLFCLHPCCLSDCDHMPIHRDGLHSSSVGVISAAACPSWQMVTITSHISVNMETRGYSCEVRASSHHGQMCYSSKMCVFALVVVINVITCHYCNPLGLLK